MAYVLKTVCGEPNILYNHYVAQSEVEKNSIEKKKFGDTCYVIDTDLNYIVDGEGNWRGSIAEGGE